MSGFFIIDNGLGIKMKNMGKVTYTFKLFIFGRRDIDAFNRKKKPNEVGLFSNAFSELDFEIF
ncbi:hypothetical protein CRG86_015890 [Photobacterium leiognathi]|nr:hypothetical protein CRG86_015890 [Photobacterium leiognathi]